MQSHYIADKCNPIPNERSIFFPVASLNVNKEEFIKSLNRSYPKLDILAPSLFNYLLEIQHFSGSNLLVELNTITNYFKHRGLQDMELATFESILASCNNVGFRIGELGFKSITITDKGRLRLVDENISAIINGPCEISMNHFDFLSQIDNLQLERESRLLLKIPNSDTSLLTLIWSCSKSILRCVDMVCMLHSEI
jgi:hypothetical protein